MTTTINADTSNGIKITSDTSGVMGLQTAGNTAVTIDGSQNVGIGVTPSAWSAGYVGFQVKNASLASYTSGAYTWVGSNWYNNSGNKYIGTGFATLYEQTDGKHIWYTAPSGTAAANISFTQAMTLDASGNLGIGTTSPNARITVKAAGNSYTNGALALVGSVSGTSYITGVGGNLYFSNNGSTDHMVLDSSGNLGIGANISGSYKLEVNGNIVARRTTDNNPHFFSMSNSSSVCFLESINGLAASFLPINFKQTHTGTSQTPMILDASGNLLLGTTSGNGLKIDFSPSASQQNGINYTRTSPSTFTDIYGCGTSGGWQGIIRFFTSDNAAASERARIDTNGNLLVGVTSGSYHTLAKDLGGNFATEIRNSNANPYGLYLRFSGAAPNGSVNEFLYCGDTVGQKMSIRSNGGIANYSGSNVNLSDRREKTNFAPAKSYLDVICSIPVQTFNYIDQNMEDDGGLTLGVVAQDVQVVAPELVMESNWAGKDEEPKMRLGIYQTDLQYALMKCIQEQQALITTLTARITALEGA